MAFRHRVAGFLLVGLLLGGIGVAPISAQVGDVPAMTSQPPQQMPAYGSSGTAVPYPSTSYSGATATGYADNEPAGTADGAGANMYPSTSIPPAAADGAGTRVMLGRSSDGRTGVREEADPIYKPYGSPEAMAASFANPPDSSAERLLNSDETWTWQWAPTGLMYKSYLASNREPRVGAQLVHERVHGWFWEATVGGRVGLVRYGTENALWPQGWQLDVEGAAFPRLDLEHDMDLMAVDFRGGLLSTTRTGPIETKFGYYHLSSHLGDEYLIRYPDALNTRINYVRDSLIAGTAVYLNAGLRLYGEVGWAFNTDGGAKPWEFQFGVDFSDPEPSGVCGAPFFAINAHLRQENNFGGNLTVQTGWQWRGRDGHLIRIGMQYFNGLSDQYEFYNTFEEQIGFGLWYDY
jgi:hypothetical protein